MKQVAVLLLCAVASVLGDTSTKAPTNLYREIIRPDALECQKELRTADDDLNLLLDMSTDKFTEDAMCLAACVLERLGFMAEGRFLPFEKNAEEYKLLDVEEDAVRACGRQAHEKFSGNKCRIAHSAMHCVLTKSRE